jgi:hypothetical protein
MMRGATVRWRLTVWYGAVLAVVLAGFGATTFVVMRQQLLERIDGGLREELSDVLGEVQRANDRSGMLSWLDRRFARHEGFDFQVTTKSGERVFANFRLGDRRLPIPELEPGAPAASFRTIQKRRFARRR